MDTLPGDVSGVRRCTGRTNGPEFARVAHLLRGRPFDLIRTRLVMLSCSTRRCASQC